MSECCHAEEAPQKKPKSKNIVFWTCLIVVLSGYLLNLSQLSLPHPIHHFSMAIFDLINKVWWGVLLGAFFVGLLDFVPRDLVMASLGQDKGVKGVLRAAFAGILLDLCSHGILMVGMKLYERGARLGQVMAFLVASPWNSFSLTLILYALIGLKWTLIFVLLSFALAISTGIVFERLVQKNVLPSNPYTVDLPKNYSLGKEFKEMLSRLSFSPLSWFKVLILGFKQSKAILKWLFIGIIIAAALRAFIDPLVFKKFMGPSLLGLGVTLIMATIIEVCSEGSTPIAADIFTRAHAPGNAFAFLMTGIATDYTEIMVLKETTKSWKIALFLPLITVPQVVAVSLIINYFS